jgi:dynein heavy chain, axonemal
LFLIYKDRDIPDAPKHVATLTEMGKQLEEYKLEQEQLNHEELLFKFPISAFPLLQEIITLKDPFDKLWFTFYNFQQKEGQWLKGPFKDLNADEITDEVQNSWRIMHKLQKSFADAISPRKVADFTKHKIDRFKNHLPILQVICNPGLKERHWKEMGALIGKELKPDDTTSLQDMIDIGLGKHLDG